MTTEPKSLHVEPDIHQALRLRAVAENRTIRAVLDAILRKALRIGRGK